MPKAARNLAQSELSACTSYANEALENEEREEEEEEENTMENEQENEESAAKSGDADQENGRSGGEETNGDEEEKLGNSCVRADFRRMPACSLFALFLVILGITLLISGVVIFRRELDNYLSARLTGYKRVGFDQLLPHMFPACLAASAFVGCYSLAHFAANAVTHTNLPDAMEGRGRVGKVGACAQAAVTVLVLFDIALVVFWTAPLCAGALLVYCHVIYSERLRRDLLEFDLNYFTPAWPIMPSTIVKHASDPVTNFRIFQLPTFLSALMICFGFFFVHIGLVMLMLLLAVNADRHLWRHYMLRRHRRTCDTQL